MFTQSGFSLQPERSDHGNGEYAREAAVHEWAGPSLSAYNYDSTYGKRVLVMLYRGIMEQEALPIVPPGCSSEKPETIEDFILKGKTALVSVGIIIRTAPSLTS